MKRTKRHYMPRLVAACAAVVLVMAMACVAYAADVGGIQRTVQLWINGEQTDAVLDIRGESYTMTYEDQNGTVHEVGGGGIAIDEDGSERPLTEEELLEHLASPNVEYRDDGSVWVYYNLAYSWAFRTDDFGPVSYSSEAIEITDRFDEDGVCYVQIETDRGTRYLTVKYHGGFATSPHRYVSPESFQAGED